MAKISNELGRQRGGRQRGGRQQRINTGHGGQDIRCSKVISRRFDDQLITSFQKLQRPVVGGANRECHPALCPLFVVSEKTALAQFCSRDKEFVVGVVRHVHNQHLKDTLFVRDLTPLLCFTRLTLTPLRRLTWNAVLH